VLRPASWSEALDVAARGLLALRGHAGVLTGGRLTLEDAYGYAKFARLALGTNDIDMRARPHSAEETYFLSGTVAGRDAGVSYTSLEQAPTVLLAGFEPEEETPIVFLRLRTAVRKRGLAVYSLAAFASAGLTRLSGTLLPTPPGDEALQLDQLGDPAVAALSKPGSVILAGERLAEVPGALSAAARLAQRTGAKLAWVPRRAGERGAIEAGALPVLLPGGRQVDDADARAEVARAWTVASLPAEPGRDTGEILAAAAAEEPYALVVAGVDPADLPDPQAARAAIERANFVVSLELRASAVTDRADVVFPVAAVAEKPGTFVNWEGRQARFGAALAVPAARSDLQVLHAIADAMDIHLALPDVASARRELSALGVAPGRDAAWTDERGAPATSEEGRRHLERPGASGGIGGSPPRANTALLSTSHNLLDAGRMQDGEPHLAGTARVAVAKMSAATAAEAGVAAGAKVTVSTGHGAITVPVEITTMPDRVVWLPSNSDGCAVRGQLGAGHGSIVTVRSAE
jgi:NADH-quinone oxidoreductase subunit G